jgi:hypothetical protein
MDNEGKYYTSTNMDARFKNMVIPGPAATAIALPTTYPKTVLTLTNGDFETGGLGNAPTGWTKTGTGTAILGPDEHSGEYECTMTPDGADFTIYQDMITWSNSYRNVPVRAEAWFYTGNVSQCTAKITIDDGVGATNSSSLAANSAWTKLTVTRTLDASATRLRIIITCDYISSNNAVLVDDCIVYMSYVDQPNYVVEFNDNLYFSMGTCIYKLNVTGNGFTYVGTVYCPITHIAPVINSNGSYLAISTGDTEAPYWYMYTGEGLVQSTIGYADFISTVGDVPYKVVQPNEIRTAVSNDITNDSSWATAITVGDSASNITCPVIDMNGTPLILKEDMPYYLDSSSNIQRLAPELISEKSSTSGLNTTIWQGRAYIPCGTQALYEYDSLTETLIDISPSKYITNSTDFDGRVVALAHDAQYLFAILDNDTKIEVLAGRWETFEEGTTWIWHPISEITLTGCKYAYASTVYARRLWISSTSASDNIYYLPLPSQYGAITNDTSYTFQSGGNLITSWIHCNFRSDKKAWTKLTLTMNNTTNTTYFKVYYQKLGDTAWTEISEFKTSPETTVYLPNDASNEPPESTMMRFKIEAVTTATAPVLLHLDVRAVWYPTLKRIIQCQVKAYDNIVLADGTMDDTQTAAFIREKLAEYANPPVCWPRAFYPPYYESDDDVLYCKMMPPKLVMARDDKTRNNAWVYNLTLLVVDGING